MPQVIIGPRIRFESSPPLSSCLGLYTLPTVVPLCELLLVDPTFAAASNPVFSVRPQPHTSRTFYRCFLNTVRVQFITAEVQLMMLTDSSPSVSSSSWGPTSAISSMVPPPPPSSAQSIRLIPTVFYWRLFGVEVTSRIALYILSSQVSFFFFSTQLLAPKRSGRFSHAKDPIPNPNTLSFPFFFFFPDPAHLFPTPYLLLPLPPRTCHFLPLLVQHPFPSYLPTFSTRHYPLPTIPHPLRIQRRPRGREPPHQRYGHHFERSDEITKEG